MFIETASGKYEIKQPGGKLGTESIIMMAQLVTVDGLKKVPNEGEEDPVLIASIVMDNEKVLSKKFIEVFNEWAPKMLPSVVVSGPFTYENMPGTDQLAIFVALSQEANNGVELFRVVPTASP